MTIFITFHVQISSSSFHDDKLHIEHVSEWKQSLKFWKLESSYYQLFEILRYCNFTEFHCWQKNKINFQSIFDRKTTVFWVSWFKCNRKEAKISKVKKNQLSCFSLNYSEFKLHVIHALNHKYCSYFSNCEMRFDNCCLNFQFHN